MFRRYRRSPKSLQVIFVLAAILVVTILPESYRKLIEPTAYAATFTVNTADDHNDGVCNGTDCSLREAINAVNAGAGGDTISFNIAGGGVRTINVSNAFGGLNITKAVTIDGTTQPGFTNSPLIELNGSGAGSVAGLNIAATNVTVKGLIINRFTNTGINIASGSATIQGNFIGTNSVGTSALGNSPAGIKIDGASACTIGGTTAAARNVISGNNGDGILITNSASNNLVQGNYIGVDATGTSAVSNTGNSLGGVNIVSSNNNTVGGSAAGAGNLLSGNDGANAYGIQINQSSGTNVQGNIIGLNAAATAAIQNDAGGIIILGGVGHTIGGTAVGREM